MAQDRSAASDSIAKPTEDDRQRFGFARKKSAATIAAVAPSAPAETETPVDLASIVQEELGDKDHARKIVKMKKSADRYDFKQRIEELDGMVGPLQDELKERLIREKNLEAAMTKVQADINGRFENFDCKLAELRRAAEDRLNQEKGSHAATEKKWKAKEEQTAHSHTEKLDEQETKHESKLNEQRALHNNETSKLLEEIQTCKDENTRQAEEAAKALQAELANFEEKTQEMEGAAKRAQDALTTECAARVEDINTKAKKQEETLQQQVEYERKQGEERATALQAEHDAVVEKMVAEAQTSETELNRRIQQQASDAKQGAEQAAAAHAAALAETEEDFNERERKLREEADQTLADAKEAAALREQEFLAKLDEQKSLAQQLTTSAKVREDKLKDEIRQVSSTAKELTANLETSRQETEDARKRIKKLETELAAEKSLREKEGKSTATLQGEHTALMKSSDEQRTLLHEVQADFAALQQRYTAAEYAKQASEEEAERLREAVGEEQATLQQRQAALDSTTLQLASTREEAAALKAELAVTKENAATVAEKLRQLELEHRCFTENHSASNEAQMGTIAQLKLSVDQLTVELRTHKVQIAEKCSDMEEYQRRMVKMEEQLSASESSRRELHNTIQELKGNIRVFCRVRPATDGASGSITDADDQKLTLNNGGEEYNFKFDKLFRGTARQEDIFTEVSELVQSALDGYKVCVFAYGQTGSGKTFTMQGGETDASAGLIPRSLKKIFQTSEAMRKQGWQWSLKASFIEVYNEVLKDLLRDESTSTPQCHTIKHDNDWGMVVTNTACVPVTNMEQINELMRKAARLRAVGSTDMNATSSRSHSIFALYLTGSNAELNTELHGALHLVDLAGSERLDRSGAVGDRLKETQNINRSLSSLADVFQAKAENRSHIPFRNSKLTHLMEPCLSGHGKTLMTVNVSPEIDNSHESLCSLRFAGQVAQCTTGGKARRSAKVLQKNASSSNTATSSTASSSLKRRGGC